MSLVQVAATSGGTTTDSGAERRWAHRKPGGYRAMINRPGSGASVPCTIVNMSTTGACLALTDLPPNTDNSLHLPAYFTLAIRVDRMEIDCGIVWRRGGQIGVRFLAAPRPMKKSKQDN